MTFTAISINKNNLINIKIPLHPIKPACLKVDRVSAFCRKTVTFRGYWNYHKSPGPPTPFPPVTILAFYLNPLLTALRSTYTREHKGFFFSIFFTLHMTIIYLDQENNKGKLYLSPQGETFAWLKSPQEAVGTATLSDARYTYNLKEKCLKQYAGKNKDKSIILFYTINLTFEFLSLQKVKLVVPTLGPCLPGM